MATVSMGITGGSANTVGTGRDTRLGVPDMARSTEETCQTMILNELEHT